MPEGVVVAGGRLVEGCEEAEKQRVHDACYALVEESLMRGSLDNMTVVAVVFSEHTTNTLYASPEGTPAV